MKSQFYVAVVHLKLVVLNRLKVDFRQKKTYEVDMRQCFFCLIRKKLCCSYFTFSRTRSVEVVTW